MNTHSGNPLSETSELDQVLQPYCQWENWFDSRLCPLSEREKQVIVSYREHGSHKPLAEKLNIHPSGVGNTYRKALRKLKRSDADYFLWLMHEFITRTRKTYFLDPSTAKLLKNI